MSDQIGPKFEIIHMKFCTAHPGDRFLYFICLANLDFGSESNEV
jgi:hypothetical protein